MNFRSNFTLTLILITAIGLSGFFISSSFAENLDNSASFLQEAALADTEKIRAEMEVEEVFQSKGQQLIEKLYKQLSASQSNYENISGSVDRTKNRLKKTETELRTLAEQLQILDEEIENTTNTVNNIRYQISKTEVELANLFENIEVKELELENQRRILTDYAQFIYFKRNIFYEEAGSNLKSIKFLLANNSVSGNLRDELYLQLMEDQGYEIFDRLAAIANNLEREKMIYEEKKIKLDALNERLTLDLNVLQEQEDSKQRLFDETKGQEEIFRQLLVYARIEQRQIEEEISQLSMNVDYLKDKLDSLSNDELINIEKDINEFIKKNYLMGITAGDIGMLPQFSWPVLPSQGISAFYQDSSYKAHFGIPHNAIDIPIPQGSPIHAPAPGIVTSAVDAGFGYSYITLTHQDGFTTLFGHVFAINVKEGDVIHRGDILGLSGGAPGSKGAGLLTTGPHLHFEVFKDGGHVDPLFFLSLRFLAKESLPDKYFELYDMEQEKIQERLSSGASDLIDSVSRQIDEEIQMELAQELGLSPSEPTQGR